MPREPGHGSQRQSWAASETIRLDEETERVLAEVTAVTGLSVSQALRKGLFVLRDELAATTRPYEIYESLDLGPGGDALAPSHQAKEAAAEAIRRKARR